MALIKKGTSTNNILTGGSDNDLLIGLGGDDLLNGGAGIDTAWYAGNIAEYSFSNINGHLVIQDLVTSNGQEGKDTLTAIEHVQFSDTQLTLSGAEFQVNTYTTSSQNSTSIIGLTNGSFVVSWTSLQDNDGYYSVYAQRYDAAGVAQGLEFQVNTTTANHQIDSDITALADGGFVVSWTSSGQDDIDVDYGIYAQRYDATGVAQGAELQVNTTTTSHQYESSITALADGGFVVSWTSDAQDGSSWGIYAQRYDATGVAQGTEFQVNTYSTGSQENSSITALADDGFVVSWTSDGQDGSGRGIYAQRYDATGVAQGAEFQVNTYATSEQYQSSITALADGGFVLSWTSAGQDGSGGGIYAQRYNASAVAQGAEFQVNTYTTNSQDFPSITALEDGGFVVSWSSHGQDNSDGSGGIYVQRYDAAGVAQGIEFQVNTYTVGDQAESSITALADGGFVVSWASFEQDGDDFGIYARRYDATGNAVGLKLTGTDNGEVVNLDAGADLIVDGAGGNDTVNGGTANDEILGGAGNDVLNGGLGDDYLDGGLGADKMTGGKGGDIYVVDAATDVITELVNGGIDEVQATFSYSLSANLENLTFTGTNNLNGTGNSVGNVLTGNGGNNRLDGKAGADVLDGVTGNDTLIGGLGNDFLQGGVGNDIFRFNTSLSAVNNVDTIMDFTVGDDSIQLSKAIFSKLGVLGGLNANAFNTGIAASDASDRIIYNDTTGDLYYDKDGTGVSPALQFAHLDAGLGLTAGDFSVIA